MQKIIDFRNYPIAIKIGLWGAVLLMMLIIMVIINSKQFRTMGVEFAVLKTEVVPAITAVDRLDSLMYQQTIARDRIAHIRIDVANKQPASSEALQSAINKNSELFSSIESQHLIVIELMKNYARLEMRATKARWIRLQEQRQKELQTSLDEIGNKIERQREMFSKSLNGITDSGIDDSVDLQSELDDIDETIHQELEKLREAAKNGINASEKKLHHMEYGARQLTLFILFWFNLIGAIIGYFIIRSIVRRINSAAEFANTIADGKSADKLDVKNQDELGNLKQALNNLAVANSTVK